MNDFDPSAPPTADNTDPIVKLTDEECWALLRENEFGRLAYHLAGEVHIVPINYATDGSRLYFRTAEGSKLLGVVMNEDVAFEIDEVTDESATSVVVRGRARQLKDEEKHSVDQLALRPWVPTVKSHVVAITPHEGEITGRSFSLSRPWTQLRRD